MNTTHTAGGTRIFSKGYAAHEQIEGKATKKSDIYSLGRTFVYLLTAKEPNDTMMYDDDNDRINWRQYAQGVSPQFADLIDLMIERVPSQRPANTQVILQQLQQVGGVAKRGEDIEVQTLISEVEAAAGTSTKITVTRTVNVNGKLQQETKQLTVRIPAGAREGQKMRLQGQGNVGEYGGEYGDVYVKLITFESVIEDILTQSNNQVIQGEDIEVELNVSQQEASSGTSKSVSFPRYIYVNRKRQSETKTLTVQVPAGSQNRTRLRLKGQGNQGLNGGNSGNVYVSL
ncbi:MAG: DnaJ C-terminal domain-containing protein [Synechocystis sp.]